MAKVVDKFLNFIGFEVVEEDEPQEPTYVKKEKQQEEENWQSRLANRRERRPDLVAVPNRSTVKMAVCKPLSFEDIQLSAQYLCSNQSTVVDLTEISVDQAQRALDYLSGVVFAINGKASRVGRGVFLFVPANVSIEGAVDLFAEQSKQKKEQARESSLNEDTISFLKIAGA